MGLAKAADAILSGCNDVLVAKYPDGHMKCTSFCVRFGRLKIRNRGKKFVRLHCNGKLSNVFMQVGPAGECSFVDEKEVPESFKKTSENPDEPPPPESPDATDAGEKREFGHVDPRDQTASEPAFSGSWDDERRQKILGRGAVGSLPSPEQLAKLNLKVGRNDIKFLVDSRMRGVQRLECRAYVVSNHTKIVVSDIDGTITKSDVGGQIAGFLKMDFSHSGIAKFYSELHGVHGQQIVYLTSRPITSNISTREYIDSVRQVRRGNAEGDSNGSRQPSSPPPADLSPAGKKRMFAFWKKKGKPALLDARQAAGGACEDGQAAPVTPTEDAAASCNNSSHCSSNEGATSAAQVSPPVLFSAQSQQPSDGSVQTLPDTRSRTNTPNVGSPTVTTTTTTTTTTVTTTATTATSNPSTPPNNSNGNSNHNNNNNNNNSNSSGNSCANNSNAKPGKDNFRLPPGPVIACPDFLFDVVFREIKKQPHLFKIPALLEILEVFDYTPDPPRLNYGTEADTLSQDLVQMGITPAARDDTGRFKSDDPIHDTKRDHPFVAAFGNAPTDLLSYFCVGIPLDRIFIVNPRSQIKSGTALPRLREIDGGEYSLPCRVIDIAGWDEAMRSGMCLDVIVSKQLRRKEMLEYKRRTVEAKEKKTVGGVATTTTTKSDDVSVVAVRAEKVEDDDGDIAVVSHTAAATLAACEVHIDQQLESSTKSTPDGAQQTVEETTTHIETATTSAPLPKSESVPLIALNTPPPPASRPKGSSLVEAPPGEKTRSSCPSGAIAALEPRPLQLTNSADGKTGGSRRSDWFARLSSAKIKLSASK
ncbi:Phosphatidate phosphatase PAH1 [Diplonema papillatum]|nr:Phosphatidate phosphatase PAH1 [Diplonema papillatum]